MPTAWKTGFPWNAGTREALIKITSLKMAEKAGLSERRDLLFQEKIPKNLKSQISNLKPQTSNLKPQASYSFLFTFPFTGFPSKKARMLWRAFMRASRWAVLLISALWALPMTLG